MCKTKVLKKSLNYVGPYKVLKIIILEQNSTYFNINFKNKRQAFIKMFIC